MTPAEKMTPFHAAPALKGLSAALAPPPAECRTEAEAETYLAEHFDPVWPALTDVERELLTCYVSVGSYFINGYLRHAGEEAKTRRRLRATFAHVPHRLARQVEVCDRLRAASTERAFNSAVNHEQVGPFINRVVGRVRAGRLSARGALSSLVRVLDGAVSAGRFGAPCVGWRGLQLDDEVGASHIAQITKPAAVLTHRGYSSVSLLRGQGEEHANRVSSEITRFYPRGWTCVLYRVEVPSGARGMTGSRFKEFEVVLPRGSRFQVREVRRQGGALEVDCVLLLENERERRARFQKFMESGGRPLWEQKLKR